MQQAVVYLIQSDTTVGFAAAEPEVLNRLKGRPEHQPVLQTLASLKELYVQTRIPKFARKTVRNAVKSTFIYQDGEARRVVSGGEYGFFLERFGTHYSTSANPSGGRFDPVWAEAAADVVVTTPEGFGEHAASSIYRLTRRSLTQLR